MFFSRPKVFKVNKPKRLAPFDVLGVGLLKMYIEKTLLTVGADSSEEIKTEAIMEAHESDSTADIPLDSLCYSVSLEADEGQRVRLFGDQENND